MSEQRSTPDLSALIGQIMRDPDSMQSIMKMAGEMGLGGQARTEAPPESRPPEGEGSEGEGFEPRPELPPVHGQKPNKPHGGVCDSDRSALLCALKPFLSKERQDKADGILRILALLSTAEKMGLLQSLTASLQEKG